MLCCNLWSFVLLKSEIHNTCRKHPAVNILGLYPKLSGKYFGLAQWIFWHRALDEVGYSSWWQTTNDSQVTFSNLNLFYHAHANAWSRIYSVPVGPRGIQRACACRSWPWLEALSKKHCVFFRIQSCYLTPRNTPHCESRDIIGLCLIMP